MPFLSLFRVSLDGCPSHRLPGGHGVLAGPREQAGTTMPLLGPGHLGAEAWGCGDPRLTAQSGRGSGSTGTGRPRGSPGAHTQARAHTAHIPRATVHTGEKGNRALRAEAAGRFTARITKDRQPRRQCGAGTPSLSASSDPEASSGPGVRPSALPSALPGSSRLCCFCRRISLYLRVMSLRAAGAGHRRPARGGGGVGASLDPAPQGSPGPGAAGRTPRGRGAHRRKKRQMVQVRASTEPSVQHWAM